jgi:ATP-dependent DNA helicase DinG
VALHVEAVLSDTGPLARRLGGFEVRPQQLEMARLVQDNLERSGRLMVEAGTGVGKSFAYLVPSIRRIVENRERIVVATNTFRCSVRWPPTSSAPCWSRAATTT